MTNNNNSNFSRWQFNTNWEGGNFMFFDLLTDGKMRIVVKQIDRNRQTTFRRCFEIPESEMETLYQELEKKYNPKKIKKTMEQIKADVLKNNPNATRIYEPWTSDQEEQLKEMANQGKSVKEIADILGRGEGGIRARMRKLGILVP